MILFPYSFFHIVILEDIPLRPEMFLDPERNQGKKTSHC